MATIEIEIAGRKYPVACRDGEEAHLRQVASLVDKRARDATAALGALGETRLLLYTALMIADDLQEARSGEGPPPSTSPAPAASLAEPLEQLAERIEALAVRLESGRPSP